MTHSVDDDADAFAVLVADSGVHTVTDGLMVVDFRFAARATCIAGVARIKSSLESFSTASMIR